MGGKIGRMKSVCHSELKRKGAGVWNFQERKGERFSGRCGEEMCGKQKFAGPVGNNTTQRASTKQALLGSPRLPTWFRP